ncbi:MAG: cupin domain-containing protein [Deltaproteobacteria bacterium]|nr:cupin domain-containing protein [Deltaproteobacteria bacterium]
MDRVFHLKKEGQPGALPAMQALMKTPHTQVVAFTVEPGQEVPQPIHPSSDDMWIILEGEGEYYVGEDKTEHVQAGMVACAPAGTVHGLKNTGNRKLVYVSVSAPQPLGFRMVKEEDAQRYAQVTGRR